MTGRSDRQAVVGGMAGRLAAGAAGAPSGSGPASTAARTTEASIDDRRILEIAGEFEAIERQRLGLFPGSGSGAVIRDDDERDAAIEPLEVAQERLVAELATLRASSVGALGAVAAALVLWEADQFPDPADEAECTNRRMSAWLSQNLARMAGKSAGPNLPHDRGVSGMTAILRRHLAGCRPAARAMSLPIAKSTEIDAPTEVPVNIKTPIVIPDQSRWPISFSMISKWAPSHTDVICGLETEAKLTHKRPLRKLAAVPEATVPIRYLIGVYRSGIFGVAQSLLEGHIHDLTFPKSRDLAKGAEHLASDLDGVARVAAGYLKMLAGDDTPEAASIASAAQIVVDANRALQALPSALRTMSADATTSREISAGELDQWRMVDQRAKVALEEAFGRVGVVLRFKSGSSQAPRMQRWIVSQCTGQSNVSAHTIASRNRRKS